MKTKEKYNLKYKNNSKIKRQVSIITVFLWIFLIATMVIIITGNIKNTNALEDDNIKIYEGNNLDYSIPSTYAANTGHTVPIKIKFIEFDQKLSGYKYPFEGHVTVNVACRNYNHSAISINNHQIYTFDIIKEIYNFLESLSKEYDVIGYNREFKINYSYYNRYSFYSNACLNLLRNDYLYVAIKEEEYDEIINIGDENSGNLFWTESIIYYSNNPYVYKETYKVKYKITSNTGSFDASEYIKSFQDVGFNIPIGYTIEPKWYDYSQKPADEISEIAFNIRNLYSDKIHKLYAHYRGDNLPYEEVELNYYDKDTLYRREVHNKGYICNIISCNNIREGYEFVGWSDSKYSNEVIYKPGDTLTLYSNKNLYAVWKPLNGIKIKVEKIWKDENNKYSKRPESIVLQIKNGEEIVEEIEVTEKSNWSYEFEVPKYDKDGNEIKYRVDEKETSEFYEKIIDGYNIINKYIREESKDENNNEIVKDIENVNTSDINVIMYVGIFIVSILVILAVILIIRKKNNK